jgi:hypothetical protein
MKHKKSPVIENMIRICQNRILTPYMTVCLMFCLRMFDDLPAEYTAYTPYVYGFKHNSSLTLAQQWGKCACV